MINNNDQLHLNRNSISIVCCADDNYSMPLAVTVRSAIENLDPAKNLILYIVDGGIKPKNKEKIERSLPQDKCTIKWISNPSERFKGFRTIGASNQQSHITLATYYRLLLDELLPTDCDKVIYLDCDLLVLEDLSKLWEVDVSPYHAMGTQHVLFPYTSSLPWVKTDDPINDQPYVTPGVMLVNLQRWREDAIAKQCIEYLRDNVDNLRYNDADVTNAVLSGKWGIIDHRWNQEVCVHIRSFDNWEDSPFTHTLTKEEYKELTLFPYITHFSSDSKPWTNNTSHPFRILFFKYVDLTEWKGFRNTLAIRIVSQLRKKFLDKINQQRSSKKID
jgi:lipopolysaccharide biosynthesis glycosyltransferase